ncbi:MAG: hypothetical protein JWM02_1483 [Frankiales bacterium]|nr:hypothetical protein [Frankiales bacterium]
MTSLRKAALIYSFGRFGLFLLVALLVYSGTGLVGHQLNGLPLLLLALIVSALGSVFLFARQRQQFAEALAAKRAAKAEEITRRRTRLEGDADV